MKKILLYYWFVPDFCWCHLYNIHLKNISMYKNRFDEIRFVIASNGDSENVELTVDRLKSVVPEAEFSFYGNDKELRESNYFYNEVVAKLSDFSKDELIFFAHNKGVASWYVDKDSLIYWIDFMYWANLYDISFLSSFYDNIELCTAGTYFTDDYKYWSFMKYGWHYSGTYFWFSPNRVLKHIEKFNENVPGNSRYFTEGFFGSVIENDDKYRLALFGNRSSKTDYRQFVQQYVPRKERKIFINIYGLQ